MMAKRVIVLILFSMLFLLPFVNASVESVLQDVADALNPLIGFLIGDIPDGELLLIKALVFLLLLAVISMSLKRMGLFDEKTAKIVSVIVAILAIRFITTDQLVNFIWLPYGGLGILIASILPFVIFFFFIESFDTSVIRKVGWVAFIAIYAMLGYLRFDTFAVSGGEWWQNLAWVYIVIALVSLLILLFEKSIRNAMIISAIRRGTDSKSIMLRSDLKKELEKIKDTLANPNITKREENELKQQKKNIENAIRRIS